MIDVPILVKDALRDGTLKKNYRFNVLNEDGTTDFTIDNDTLVKESVSIDERMCSGDTLKFGLCEGSSLEFQYFNHPNITNRRIQAFIDVQYERDGAILEHEIPMGFFDVKESSRQASTGIIKVVAYNKLQSEYLDKKANELLTDNIESEDYTETISLYRLLQKTMSDYAIDTRAPQITKTNVYRRAVTADDIYTYTLYNNDGTSTEKYLHVITNRFVNSWEDRNAYVARKVSSEIRAITTKLWDDFFTQNPQYADKCLMARLDGDNAQTHRYYSLREIVTTKHHDVLKSLGSYSNVVASLGNLKGMICWRRSTSGTMQYLDALYGLTNYNTDELLSSFRYAENITVDIYVPLGIWVDTTTSADTSLNSTTANNLASAWSEDFINNYGGIISYDYKKELTPLENYRVTEDFLTNDITLRDLQSAVYESGCQFGQLDRKTDLFSGHELNGARLLPQETLYPEDTLYPYGGNLSAFKSMYSKLWADEGNIQSWRYLIITYKGLDEGGNEKEYKLQRTVNEHGTQNYNCSDNWLFKNLIWTSEQIGQYADAMVEKMRDMRWFPFEMWCAGLPYVETGDEIEIAVGENTYTTYVLQRQLKGIQNLQDTYINGTLDIF